MVLPNGGVRESSAPVCVCVCFVSVMWVCGLVYVCVCVWGGGVFTCQSLTVASVEVLDHHQLLPQILVDDFRGTHTFVPPQHAGHTNQRFVDLPETFRLASTYKELINTCSINVYYPTVQVHKGIYRIHRSRVGFTVRPPSTFQVNFY